MLMATRTPTNQKFCQKKNYYLKMGPLEKEMNPNLEKPSHFEVNQQLVFTGCLTALFWLDKTIVLIKFP